MNPLFNHRPGMDHTWDTSYAEIPAYLLDGREGMDYRPKPIVVATEKFFPTDNPTIYYYRVERTALEQVLGAVLDHWPDTLWIRGCDGAVYGNQWGQGDWLSVLHVMPVIEGEIDDG